MTPQEALELIWEDYGAHEDAPAGYELLQAYIADTEAKLAELRALAKDNEWDYYTSGVADEIMEIVGGEMPEEGRYAKRHRLAREARDLKLAEEARLVSFVAPEHPGLQWMGEPAAPKFRVGFKP